MEKMRSNDTSRLIESHNQKLNKDHSISTEIELVKEIKDISDELNNISKVFRKLIQVAQLFSKGYERVLAETDR